MHMSKGKPHGRRSGRTGYAPNACLAIAAAWLACLLLTAAPARAVAVTDQRPLLFGFDGSDTTAGRFAGVRQIAIDEATGDLYVLSVAGVGRGTGSEQEPSKRVIDKFNYKGEAQSFAWTGTSSLTGAETLGGAFGVEGFFDGGSGFTDIGVDDSCAVHEPPLSGSACESFDPADGDLYVQEEAGPLHVFNSEGRYQCTLTRTTVEPGGFSIDASGSLWLIDRNIPRAREFANTGCSPGPPAQIGEFALPAGNGSPLRPAVDASGNDLYVADANISGTTPIIEKYVSGTPDSALTTMVTRDLTVDRSGAAGHVFAIGETKFQEFEPCASPGCGGNEVAGSPFGGDLIGDGRGVAYSPARDWVYVSDLSSGAVKVFGPPTSGTAPDVKTEEADEIGETEATLHGTINPQNVPNSYHFEWVRGEAQRLTVEATGGTFRLSTGGFSSAFTEQMPVDVSPAALEAELEGLYGANVLSVMGTPAAGGEPGEYTVVFENGFAGHDVQQMESDSSSLTGGAHKAAVKTVTDGQPWGAAQPQPTLPESNPSIEPSDSVDHPVSQSLTNLRPNTTYDTRLVGTNTEPEGDPEKRLNAYASPDTFTTLPPPTPTVSGLAVSEIAPESAKVAVTVDPQGDETVWQILTSTEAKPGASQLECEALPQLAFDVAKEGTIPLGEAGTVNIEKELSGLEPSQTYCLRVVATNGGGSAGEDAVFTTGAVAPTEVKLAFAAPRTDTSATLNFYVNPQGEAPLAYRFEYSADGASWTPLEEVVSTVEARRQIVVGEEVGGLTSNTTYQYRLGFVKNEAGEFPKGSLPSPKSFTTRTSAEMTLPPNALGEAERRGIELVNNPDKGNQHVLVLGFLSGSDSPVAADGSRMVWTLAGGAPGGTSGVYNAFLAEREEAGWRSRPIVPPAEEQVGGGSLKYRAEFASPDFTHFIFRTEGGLFPGEDPKSTYVRLDDRQHQEVLAHFDANAFSTPVDVTADTAHVLHTPEDTNLLEDIGSDAPEVVGLMPGGSPPSCGIHSATEFAGMTGGSVYAYPGYHWISSTDASRVYFETQGSECSGPDGLYMRNRGAGTTTQIAKNATFVRATTDGHSGFFTTAEALASADKNSDLDVYEWTEGGGATCLTCVVKDANVSAGHAAVRVSDDFSHVYFLSTSQFVSGLGRPGDLNIYVVSGGKLRFVADPDETSVLSSPGQMEMSNDGNVLAFLSSAVLTADRTGSSCTNTTIKEPHPCRELYRYDDRDGSLECVSCKHGAVTNGDVFTESNNGGVAFRISSDGSTIAFTTPQSLLPADVNGSYDVYEWRNGATRLITDGETRFATGLAAPDLAGIDADGANVFFVVTDPGLTGFEHDGVDNVYDARIDGGFPRPAAATHCSEESCQGPLQGAPDTPAPTSDSFQGAGNLPRSRHCSRHKVRRHGRCARRHRHKVRAK